MTWILLLGIVAVSAQKKEFSKDKQDKVKAVFKKYIEMGIPGLALTVYNEDIGFWSYADGVSNIEKKIQLTNDHRLTERIPCEGIDLQQLFGFQLRIAVGEPSQVVEIDDALHQLLSISQRVRQSSGPNRWP